MWYLQLAELIILLRYPTQVREATLRPVGQMVNCVLRGASDPKPLLSNVIHHRRILWRVCENMERLVEELPQLEKLRAGLAEGRRLRGRSFLVVASKSGLLAISSN